jgi:hypothetical protein
MTVAAAIEGRTAGSPARSKASRIASLDILSNLEHAETIWRSLEHQQHFSTPYQRFDFLAPWQQMLGAREGISAALAGLAESNGAAAEAALGQ